MTEYKIDNITIRGHVFRLDESLTLQDALELAKEFQSHNYIYHIKERLSSSRFEHVSLSELEKRAKEQKLKV